MIRACKRKLNDSKGSSLIIAMVFMLICVFVGGSVLTAATMNAYRIEHLNDQDDFLLQRSAALLVSEDLGGDPLKLTILDSSITTRDLRIKASGEIVYTSGPKPEHKVIFTIDHWDGDAAPFKRTVYEAAIFNYLNSHGIKQNSGVTVQIFARNVLDPTTKEMKPLEDLKFLPAENTFWCAYPAENQPTTGTFTVEGKAGTGSEEFEIPRFDATFVCDNRTEHQYDYNVTFDEASSAKKDIQMRIFMLANGAESSRRIPQISEIVPGEKITGTNDKIGEEITTDSTMTTISWMSPRIEKGNVG